MEGDGEDLTIIEELYGGVTILTGAAKKNQGAYSSNVKTSSKNQRSNAETSTDSSMGNRFARHVMRVPSYAAYRSPYHQINQTPAKPTMQECSYINAMSKDTRYFAQTLRKYPLPKPQTKSSDLIQAKIKRDENKTISSSRKVADKKGNIRKTASQQAFKSNTVFECKVQDSKRLRKVEEILPIGTNIEHDSGNKAIDHKYNYLNAKPKQSNVDVRYCTTTKKGCTCKRIKNVVCTRPENCPNIKHRLDHHRQVHHDKDVDNKPSCHCNVCQASQEPTSTSRLSPSEYANLREQDEEVQLLTRNYLESSHEAINFEEEIKQWTQAKLKNDDVVQIKLIQKLAKALGDLTKDKGFLPEARHEVIKYLTALSVVDLKIKDKIDYLADDLLNNLSRSLKNTKSPINSKNANDTDKDYFEKKTSQYPSDDSKFKMFIKHFLNQLPIEKDKNNDQLDTIVEKFMNILKEHNIKHINLSNNTDEYEEKDFYLNRILSWYNSMPELEQKLQLQIYDNIEHFQDLANKLIEMNKIQDLKENIDKVKVEIMQWFKNYLTLYNVSNTDNLQEKFNDKLVTKLVTPAEERYYKGLPEKDWITKDIYILLENENHKIQQNNHVLELVKSLVIHLSYIKEKNNGNLTLHQCENELKTWFEYLEKKLSIHFQENEKTELEYKILSRIKILLNHEKHKKSFHLSRLKLLTKIVLEEISKSVIENDIIISKEKLLSLITDIISLVFETYINEKLISKSVYEKVCTVLHSILNLPADEIKGIVKTILDKITSTWKNIAESHLKENTEIKEDEVQTPCPTKNVYKSQWATSTPRQSKEGLSSEAHVDFNVGDDSTGFSTLINENLLQKIIKDWLEEHSIKLNEIDKHNIIKSITSDIVCRYNYARAFSKTRSDLEEIEYLKYFIFKVLGEYMKEQDINNIISKVRELHETINKTLTSAEISVKPEENNENPISLEVLKNNLVNAFINLNSYLVDERFKNEYKGKLKEEINNFCSQYFQRFPATPLDTEQLRSNVYNALDNVPKPPPTKSEINILTQIRDWLDELCKENNLPNHNNENEMMDLVNPLLQKKRTKSILNDSEDELSQTISQWIRNYTKKQKTSINDQYWTDKLLERLRTLDDFKELNLSERKSAHMYTIPAAESFGAQAAGEIFDNEDNNELLAKDLLTNEDRELLSRIKDRSSIPNTETFVKSQTDFVDDKPEHELVSPNVCVREYHWESIEPTQTSISTLPPCAQDRSIPRCLQPNGLDHTIRTKDSKDRNVDVNEPMIPEKLKKTKCKNKTCRFKKRSMTRRCMEPTKVVCPNKYTLKSKSFDKDVPCSCSDCVINKYRIKYFCKKSENNDLENCPQCFGGYCPFPSCAYFE